MNTLHTNSDQMSSPAEIQGYFQEDPKFAAVAATYLYFQLLELSQNQKLLEKEYDTFWGDSHLKSSLKMRLTS